MVGVKGQPTPGNPNIKNFGWGSGYMTKEQENEYRSRPKVRWTKEKCLVRVNDILDKLDKLLLETEKTETNPTKLKLENIRDLKIMMNSVFEYLKYLYPPVQENVNINLDATSDRVLEKLKNWKTEQIVEFIPNQSVVIEQSNE